MFESREEYERAVYSVALTIANCRYARAELDRMYIKGLRKMSWVVLRKAIKDSMVWGDYAQLFEDDKNLFKAEVIELVFQCGYMEIPTLLKHGHQHGTNAEDTTKVPGYARRAMAMSQPHPETFKYVSNFLYNTKTTNTKENPMDHEATHPVMIGNIDILTASDDTLVSLIRKGRKLIKEEADIAATSAKFTKRADLIQSNIDLCNKQLDGETDEPEKS